MAVKGLIANMGAMAAFMAVMSTGFKVFENLSKSETAIEAVRDALDGLFEDAQTREGLKAQQSELEKLLEEYEQKGPEFDNVVKAIETRLEDTKNSLREANNVFEEQMAEIGSTLLFDTTVDDKIGDLEKRLPAIAEFIGADAELLIDSITNAIGKEISESTVDASPRDLLEGFI
jgi:chromosome segregation ATPase